jgi:tetratricopeptide (TPR) repeat protein
MLYNKSIIIIIINFTFLGLFAQTKEVELLLKAKYQYSQQQYAVSLTFLDSIKPTTPEYYQLKANIFKEQSKLEAAINEYQKQNTLMPHSADYNLACLYSNTGNIDSAFYYLSAHLSSNYKQPSNIIEQEPKLENLRLSNTWASFWSKPHYSDNEKAIERALYYRQKEDVSLALDILDELLAKDKSNTEALYYRAQSIIELNNDYKYAIGDLKGAVKQVPNSDKYWRLLGEFYMHEYKYKKAVEAYENVVKLNPYDLQDYYKLSNAQYRSALYEEALRTITFYLSIEDKNQEAYKLAGLIYYDSKQYQKSVDVLTTGLYLNSKRADMLLARGMAFLDMEQYKKATFDFNLAVDLDNTNGEIWYMKGLSLLYQDRKGEACKCFRRASQEQYYKADELLLKECQ